MSNNEDKNNSCQDDDAGDQEASQAATSSSSSSSGKNNKNKKEPADELSAEDKELKENLELLVFRVRDSEAGVARLALETMRTEIRTSTSSMTSVPKPLKFLRQHYPTLKAGFSVIEDEENKRLLADILSILAMTTSKEGERESIRFKLVGNLGDIGSWGHEYVRHLSREIAEEYAAIQQQQTTTPADDDDQSESSTTATDDDHQAGAGKPMELTMEQLLLLVEQIVPYNMAHNAEHEACDLLMEVQQLKRIDSYVDKENCGRVCLYLLGCAEYVAEPEDTEILQVALRIFQNMNEIPNAIRVAFRLKEYDTARDLFTGCSDPSLKNQLGFIMAQQRLFDAADEIEDEELSAIVTNSHLHSHFSHLARDLGVMEPKKPEDIYKSHLVESRAPSNVDSARANLASTYVNAFVNAGFGTDKLMTEDAQKWIQRNKDHGKLAAAASLGMIYMWDVETLCGEIDKFTHASNDYIRAGAHLAVGLVSSGMKTEFEPALAFFDEVINSVPESERVADINANPQKKDIFIASCLSVGIAYAGTNRVDLIEQLKPLLQDSNLPIEIASIAALAIGLIGVGSADGDATDAIITLLVDTKEADLKNTFVRFACLGLGLLYFGQQENTDVADAAAAALSPLVANYARVTLQTCAYAGTGNVLQVQELLRVCGQHLDKDADASHQSVAAIGIALIAMGEELGSQMSLRAFDHLLQYGDVSVRRAVPLAYSLISLSYPAVNVTDTLSKLSHDNDVETAQNAILGLGLIGAGTNNSRIAGMLRLLSAYYGRDPNTLFIVRIAQGLLHMGKGTLTLDPFVSSAAPRYLAGPSMAGVLAVLHAAIDMKNLLLDSSHYLFFLLSCSMRTRMLMTLNEDLEPIAVDVRVGQALDVVGQAGKPKTITAFQTHTTPVLLSHGERAELVSDDYIPLNPNLDGVVILRKKEPAAASSVP